MSDTQQEPTLSEERDFRERMLTFAARCEEQMVGMRADMTDIRADLQAHDQRDQAEFRRGARRMRKIERKLGATNQIVVGNSNRWTIAASVAGILASIVGGVWVIFEKVIPLLKP